MVLRYIQGLVDVTWQCLLALQEVDQLEQVFVIDDTLVRDQEQVFVIDDTLVRHLGRHRRGPNANTKEGF